MKDVTTPVPRVLLSVTLAEPAPSGSTGTSRLRQGCSHLHRHHSVQAALSYVHLLRQANGDGLSPPLEQQRLTAQPLILTQSDSTKVVTLGLFTFVNQYGADIPALLAGVLLSAVPILVVYLFARRTLISGLMGVGGK